MINFSSKEGYIPKILNAVKNVNKNQRKYFFNKILKRFESGNDQIKGKQFGIWGLSFKPGTDDMREASSVVLINELLKRGAAIKAYDPVAGDVAVRELPKSYFAKGALKIVEQQYDAALDSPGDIPSPAAMVEELEEFLKSQGHRPENREEA